MLGSGTRLGRPFKANSGAEFCNATTCKSGQFPTKDRTACMRVEDVSWNGADAVTWENVNIAVHAIVVIGLLVRGPGLRHQLFKCSFINLRCSLVFVNEMSAPVFFLLLLRIILDHDHGHGGRGRAAASTFSPIKANTEKRRFDFFDTIKPKAEAVRFNASSLVEYLLLAGAKVGSAKFLKNVNVGAGMLSSVALRVQTSVPVDTFPCSHILHLVSCGASAYSP